MIPGKMQRVFAAMAVLVVGAALVWGFVIVGSPATARLRKFDERRVDDLRSIHHAIQRMVIDRADGRVQLKRSLPRALTVVAAYVRGEQNQRQLQLHDPRTGDAYEYTVRGQTGYELCATFALPRSRKEDLFWNHPSGRHCFVFDAVQVELKRLRIRP